MIKVARMLPARAVLPVGATPKGDDLSAANPEDQEENDNRGHDHVASAARDTQLIENRIGEIGEAFEGPRQEAVIEQ